jgi:hypothetical protein
MKKRDQNTGEKERAIKNQTKKREKGNKKLKHPKGNKGRIK